MTSSTLADARVGPADGPAPAPSTDRAPGDTGLPRLVYVLGAGRSGSTVLGIALGNLPGVFYGGELVVWNHFRGKPNTGRADVQDLWRRVASGISHRAEHHRTDFLPLLEHHSALLHPRRLLDRDLHRRYASQNADLFRSIRRTTGCRILVDSSHFPLRVLRLRRLSGLDVRVVHLVRDPERVIDALQKPVQRRVPMGPLQANLYCWAVAILSRLVLWTVPRSARVVVRYEDLVADPATTLARLADLIGSDAGVARSIATKELTVPLLFHGNRLREQRRLRLEAPPAEPSRLPRRWQRFTAIVQAPLRLGYGYLGDRRPRPVVGAG